MGIQHAMDILEKELKATEEFKKVSKFRHGYFYREEDIKALEEAIRVLREYQKEA